MRQHLLLWDIKREKQTETKQKQKIPGKCEKKNPELMRVREISLRWD